MTQPRYNDEEAREILARALASEEARERGVSENDLIEAASEVGISPEAMKRAAEELRLERLAEERLREKSADRRRGWWSSLATYAVVSGFLVLLDSMTPGGPWWQWPMMGWGFFVVMGGLRAYLPHTRAKQRNLLNKEIKRIQAKEEKRRKRAARRNRTGGSELEEAIENGVNSLLSAAARGVAAATEHWVESATASSDVPSPQVRVSPSEETVSAEAAASSTHRRSHRS